MISKRSKASRKGKPPADAADDCDDLSFGSVLDDGGFQPLGRRRLRPRDVDVPKTALTRHALPRGVRYDQPSGLIVIEFSNDAVFTAPARAFQGLADATDAEIADVELLGDTLLHWSFRDINFEIAMVMSGNFSSDVYSGGRKNAAHTIEPPDVTMPQWVAPVIKFVSDNLPGDSSSHWYHDFLTAYQIGCETLVALGQAEGTGDGARPIFSPSLPAILPRRDDVAVAVIFLAAQNGLIAFHPSGAEEHVNAKEQDFDFLHGAGGTWAARSHPDVTNIFRMLGILDGFEWTEVAVAVLWRDSPNEWHIDFESHPRFLKAVEQACETMPEYIRAAVGRFSQVTEEDIAIYVSHPVSPADGSERIMRLPPQTREQAISTVLWIRRFDFDELFYKFWRIEDGWLDQSEASRALEIFNDPLAIAMRKAVAARLYPHLPHLAE
jgi:hypothetical protein